MRQASLALSVAFGAVMLTGCGPQALAPAGSSGVAQPVPLDVPQIGVPSQEKSREVSLFMSYLAASNRYMMQAPPADRRPKSEILADLKALPKDKLLSLRGYVLKRSYLRADALDLLGQLLPEGHKEFLFEAAKDSRWCQSAVICLSKLGDPSVVDPILDRVKPERVGDLMGLVRPDVPGFLDAIKARHLRHPASDTAFLLGCYGRAAEKEIRQCAATGNRDLRRNAFYGLSLSKSNGCLDLLLELADLSDESESSSVANRFVAEGDVHVPKLLAWLNGPPDKEQVAAHALSRIKSEAGVTAVLTRYQDKPYDNSLVAECAKASPPAAQLFIADRLRRGNKQEKLFALLLAHHLSGYEHPVPGSEHPLVEPLLLVSHDPDDEVRRQSTGPLTEFACDAAYPEGRKVLRRLVEMIDDPSPGVRSEAAVQASQYPCPEVLKIVQKRAKTETDARTRESLERTAERLAKLLEHLPGMGRKPVHLIDAG